MKLIDNLDRAQEELSSNSFGLKNRAIMSKLCPLKDRRYHLILSDKTSIKLEIFATNTYIIILSLNNLSGTSFRSKKHYCMLKLE